MTDKAEPAGPALFKNYDLDRESKARFLALRLGLGQANRALSLFPLSALLENLDALEAFQDGAIAGGSTADFEAVMLGHGIRPLWGGGKLV